MTKSAGINLTEGGSAVQLTDGGYGSSLAGIGNGLAVLTDGGSAGGSQGTDPLPFAPLLKATALGGGRISVRAMLSDEDDTWNLYRGTTPGGESPVPIASGLLSSGVGQDPYIDAGLMLGQTYFYYAVAVDVRGQSPPSNEVSARVM